MGETGLGDSLDVYSLSPAVRGAHGPDHRAL